MTITIPELHEKAVAARNAARDARVLTTQIKNDVLASLADAIERETNVLLEANRIDMDAGRVSGLNEALLDRLMLDHERLSAVASGVTAVAALQDPIGESFDQRTLPNGLQVERRRIPIGVIGAIYESRPNVTVDIAALCLKSGNVVVLRGGKEAHHSNRALTSLVRQSLTDCGVNPDIVQQIDDGNRSIVEQMIRAKQHFDLIIPRGGAGLIDYVANEATVPAITGGIGVVHAYVDASADVEQAVNIIRNSKIQRPTVCNALDTVLVHQRIASILVPKIVSELCLAGVELRCDTRSLSMLDQQHRALVGLASEADFGQEFLALIMSMRVVDSIDDAISHIERYGSGHTETILTEDGASGRRFLDEVDASLVLVNASTRFNDGAELGLGGEVAISTNRLHARGPMGLRELTSYKWVAQGVGQIRD